MTKDNGLREGVQRKSVAENCARQMRRGGGNSQESTCVEKKLRTDEDGCDIKRQDPNAR